MKFKILNETWQMALDMGYTPITTLWDDFSIADRFGSAAIKDTYKKAFDFAKDDYKYLTELVMVLNHKIWYWYNKNEKMGHLYNSLWEETDSYAMDNLKDEELSYFLETTD